MTWFKELFIDEALPAIERHSQFGSSGESGGGLNFKIVRYSTEADLLLATPANNTFGVITEHDIPVWSISPSEPTELVEGMVWLYTAPPSTDEFNALSHNGIQVLPFSVKQYIDSAWVTKVSYFYKDSEWTQFSFTKLYLYLNGDRNLEITGDYHRTSPTDATIVPDGQTSDGTIFLDFPNRSDENGLYKSVIMYTGKMIDVTKYNYLVEKSIHGRSGDRILLADDTLENVTYVQQTLTTNDMQTMILDISEFIGSYYISFNNFNNGYDNWDMYELYLCNELPEE